MSRAQEVLHRLRQLMQNLNVVPQRLCAYIIPSEDAHQSEYVADCDKRRGFISGFTGSRGVAVVTQTAAALWTDGRYFLQATNEMSSDWTLMREGLPDTPTMSEWLGTTLSPDSAVGVDPELMTSKDFVDLQKELDDFSMHLVPVTDNLIDNVWAAEQPHRPKNAIDSLSLVFSGRSIDNKLEEVRTRLAAKKADFLVLSALDEIAYSFRLFVDSSRFTENAKNSLGNVQIQPYSEIRSALGALVQSCAPNMKFWKSRVSYSTCSPVELMKGVKNSVECAGMKNAHIKDAVAHCDFLLWLEKEMESNKSIDEIKAAAQFLKFRQEQSNFMGLSFETISASGPHGAILHYAVNESTNATIEKNNIFLCDSGGQYRDGTTDVTRTVCFTEPSEYIKNCYTRVLKGHLKLAMLIFPENINGYRLDCMSRTFLWEEGLDFLHGTGHGVGHYLNVHEGPAGFMSRMKCLEGVKENMMLTIEPGYYEEGFFGIRLENVYRTVEAKTKYNFKGMKFLTFEPLTLVPFHRQLILPELMTTAEINWLNNYHSTVSTVVGNELEKQGKSNTLCWLRTQTQPIG